jgi:MoaA/NifB/PqqE/SkfB family radical SAM enzyme
LRIKLNSPFTLWNEHEFEAMYALADDLGVQVQFDTLITRRDNGDAEPQRISASLEGLARLAAHQRERDAVRRAGSSGSSLVMMPRAAAPRAPNGALAAAEAPVAAASKHCGAGSSSITVDPFGNVYPCVQWRRRIGNLHVDSIRDLWNHSDQLAEVRRLGYEIHEAVDRQRVHGLGFCPGSAEQEMGSPTKLYPGIQLMRDMRSKSKVA